MLVWVADLLADNDLEVRKDAWSTFLKHRPALVEDFDPNGPSAQRKAAAKRVNDALGR